MKGLSAPVPIPFPASERLAGWMDELGPAGADVRSVFQQHPPDHGSPAIRRVLASSRRPTAVLCYSDAIGLLVVREAASLGLRMPEDVSVVGFDNSPLMQHLEMPLTTVHQDIAGKGRVAAATLIDAIRAHRTGAPVPGGPPQVRLPARLVVRASTAPPAVA